MNTPEFPQNIGETEEVLSLTDVGLSDAHAQEFATLHGLVFDRVVSADAPQITTTIDAVLSGETLSGEASPEPVSGPVVRYRVV